MAKPTLEIQFPTPADPDLMFRVLNFAEEVHRQTGDAQIGSIDQCDSYGDGRFIVSINSKRTLSQVNAIVERELRHERLENIAVVTRTDLRRI